MFSVPYYSNKLNELRKERGMDAMFNTNLVEVKAADKTAVFESLAGENKGQKIEKQFDLLHVTPPMSPLDFIKASPIADAAGWVDVSQSTLQHTKFSNIFSLGDCSSLPTSKTAAAITAQTPVLVENLRNVAKHGKVGSASYDGYTSCPVSHDDGVTVRLLTVSSLPATESLCLPSSNTDSSAASPSELSLTKEHLVGEFCYCNRSTLTS